MLAELNEYHTEIPPVFNRDGEYLMGDKCWFEVRDRAFLADKEHFLYQLKIMSMKEVDCQVIVSLLAISRIDSSVLTKDQKQLISDYNVWLSFRTMMRRSLINLKRFKMSVKEKQNKLV